VGHFEEAKRRGTVFGGIGEARWLLGVHRRAGMIRLLASVGELSVSPPSVVFLTGHIAGQQEFNDIERNMRVICKLLPPRASIIFTGLCKPTFTEKFLKDAIEKHSGHSVGVDIGLSYIPICWSGETLQRFREKPKLFSEFGPGLSSRALEVLLSIFPSITTSAKLSATEAAGLFGPIWGDVLRAMEFELASL